MKVTVSLTGGIEALDLVRGDDGAVAKEVEICIVNGANICPPEPLDLVWTCITTGMLAGSECPEPPKADGETRVFLTFRSAPRFTVEPVTQAFCKCSYKCATFGSFVNPQIDPYFSDTIWAASEEHCRAHSTIECAALNKNLHGSVCLN